MNVINISGPTPGILIMNSNYEGVCMGGGARLAALSQSQFTDCLLKSLTPVGPPTSPPPPSPVPSESRETFYQKYFKWSLCIPATRLKPFSGHEIIQPPVTLSARGAAAIV